MVEIPSGKGHLASWSVPARSWKNSPVCVVALARSDAVVEVVNWWTLAPAVRNPTQCRFCRAEISSSMFTNSVG